MCLTVCNSCLTAARLCGYETLLTQPNNAIERCSTVNPASLLAERAVGIPHECEKQTLRLGLTSLTLP
jgi:hypothetical protein